MYCLASCVKNYWHFNLQASQEDQSTPLDAHHLPLTLYDFEVTCSFENLEIIPVAFDYKLHFVPKLSDPSQVEICDLQKGVFLQNVCSSAATNCSLNTVPLCSTLLEYSEKITVFANIHKRIGLYSLNTSRNSWDLVESSDFCFQNIDFENCVCCKDVSDNVIVVTVVKAFIFCYLFSPLMMNGVYWRSAKLSLSKQICNCQVQSCVISKDLFCSFLTNTHLIIYQLDLNKIYPSANSETHSVEPTKSWILGKLNLKMCFLSLINQEVVTIIVKETDKISCVEFSELRHFNSGSLEPISPFCSDVKVFYATVIPDTTNLAIVYFDSNVYKLCLLNGKFIYWGVTYGASITAIATPLLHCWLLNHVYTYNYMCDSINLRKAGFYHTRANHTFHHHMITVHIN